MKSPSWSLIIPSPLLWPLQQLPSLFSFTLSGGGMIHVIGMIVICLIFASLALHMLLQIPPIFIFFMIKETRSRYPFGAHRVKPPLLCNSSQTT